MNKPLRLYDNTRIAAFRKCPRYFYFRHVRHWKSKKENRLPLIFGQCWHTAMEIIWPMLVAGEDKTKIMHTAIAGWTQKWIEEGMPPPKEIDYELQKELSPRTPGVAIEMLVEYIDSRWERIQKDGLELVSCEQAFIVPLDPDDDSLFYIGKMDKVVRQRGKFRAIEHKTTTAYKKGGGFRNQFLDSFSPNSQVDGYLYALHLTYPGKVGGVWVDAALVHKEDRAFTFIPVERQLPQLDMWLWEVRSWIDDIEANKVHLDTVVSSDDKYMAAYRKNTDSCWDFNSACEFLDLCKMWPNPHGKPLPNGYEENPWNPLDHLPPVKIPGEEK